MGIMVYSIVMGNAGFISSNVFKLAAKFCIRRVFGKCFSRVSRV